MKIKSRPIPESHSVLFNIVRYIFDKALKKNALTLIEAVIEVHAWSGERGEH